MFIMVHPEQSMFYGYNLKIQLNKELQVLIREIVNSNRNLIRIIKVHNLLDSKTLMSYVR